MLISRFMRISAIAAEGLAPRRSNLPHQCALISYIDEHWGSGASLPQFAPSKAEDVALQHWWGKFERLGASPSAAMALMRMNRDIDITGILHSIRVPTLVLHLTDDTLIDIEGGRELAAGI